MSIPVYSILEAASTGRLGSVYLGQTKEDLLSENPWIREDRLDAFQEWYVGDFYTGCTFDYRPYYEIKLYEIDDPFPVTAVEFPLPYEADLPNYQTNDYIPYSDNHLEELGVTDFVSAFGFLVDLCGLFNRISLQDCERILKGHRLKALKPYLHSDIGEDVRVRVDHHLDLWFRKFDDDDHFYLIRAELLPAEETDKNLFCDIGLADRPWAAELETRLLSLGDKAD